MKIKSFFPFVLACLFVGTSDFSDCGSTPSPTPVTDTTPASDVSPVTDVIPATDSVSDTPCTAATCECATETMLAYFPTCPDANDAAYCGPNGIGEDFLTTCNTAVNRGA